MSDDRLGVEASHQARIRVHHQYVRAYRVAAAYRCGKSSRLPHRGTRSVMGPPERAAISGLFGGIFGATPEPVEVPRAGVADACRHSTARALKVSPDSADRELGAVLERATMEFNPAEGPDRAVLASLMVEPVRLAFARQHADRVVAELQGVVEHHGWQLRGVRFIAATTMDPPPPVGPPKRLALAAEIAGAAAQLKSYDVEAFCARVGIPPSPHPDADPHRSKAGYVKDCIDKLELPDLVTIAIAVLGELDSPDLAAMVDRCNAIGVAGSVKNLIFGSTRKPDLVLTDALSNDLALMNTSEALMYDGGISDDGLSWRALVHWCLPAEAEADEYRAAKRLFKRLDESLGSEPERLLFKVFASATGSTTSTSPPSSPRCGFTTTRAVATPGAGNPFFAASEWTSWCSLRLVAGW